MRNNNFYKTWGTSEQEMLEAGGLTQEEIAVRKLHVALIREMIQTRKEMGITQVQLAELSGVKQPVISKMESGSTSPQLDTLLKVLNALGKTLTVVPIDTDQ